MIETAFDDDDVYKQMTPEQRQEYRSAYDKQLSRKERTMLDAILSPPVVRNLAEHCYFEHLFNLFLYSFIRVKY